MKFYDDDMDELFNKAGRDYPLKTEPKNWDAVRGALHPEDGTAETQKRNGWRRLLPLLFLLLIPAVYVFIDKDNIVGNSQQGVKATPDAVTNSQSDNTNTKNERITNSDQQKSGNKVKSDNLNSNSVNTVDNRTMHNNNNNNKENTANKISDREVTRLSYGPPSTQKLRNDTKVEEEIVVVKGGLSGPPQAGKTHEPLLWNSIPSLNTQLYEQNGPSEVISMNTPLRLMNQSGKSVPNSEKSNKKTKNNAVRKGPYLGVIAAPDLSTIKGQAIKGVGYSAGAIVGYTLSSRWQVEAGMLWSRKKYYTDGKYFDKKGPRIPDNVNVLWLDGGCQMFEFPVVARYNFSRKKNTFFGSMGLTSYVMKKEDYNYSAKVGSVGYPYEGYKKYDRSGDHLFANLQLSAGYNYSLSSKLNIRIEPYLKAPLKKIGIGKMPVTSTGLYFAITRDLR